jgi:hypothetical protein
LTGDHKPEVFSGDTPTTSREVSSWKDADPDRPEVTTAKEFLAKNSSARSEICGGENKKPRSSTLPGGSRATLPLSDKGRVADNTSRTHVSFAES